MKPAMTKEEWRVCETWETGGYFRIYLSDKHGSHSTGLQINLAGELRIFGCPARGDFVDSHKLAALCLHNQEFGFTRKDVEMLRWEAEDNRRRNQKITGQYIDCLANRIEALLPPEEE